MKIKGYTATPFFIYLIKFLGVLCILYFGTTFIVGLTVPGGYYSPFIAQYLNYPDWLGISLLKGARLLLSMLGYTSELLGHDVLRLQGGKSILLAFPCLGYGIMSFWAAFVFANTGTALKKAGWILGGWLALWLINVIRIALLLISLEKHWPIPFGFSYHTQFNIVAYLLIFIMMWVYDRYRRG